MNARLDIQKMGKKTKCPACGAAMLSPFVALSRFDNRTKVCSDCGTYEAMVQFDALMGGRDPKGALKAPGLAF